MSFTYEYPRPAVTVDIVLFLKGETTIEVLLIQRKHEPFKHCWATPGGFIDENEDPLAAAKRELLEETNIDGVELKPIGFSGTPKRDPRGHTVSLWYMGFVMRSDVTNATAQDDAKALEWFDISALPKLAFDHDVLLDLAKQEL